MLGDRYGARPALFFTVCEDVCLGSAAESAPHMPHAASLEDAEPAPHMPHAASLEDTVLDDSVLEACQVLHDNVNEAGY